jgi:hypothetical protein
MDLCIVQLRSRKFESDPTAKRVDKKGGEMRKGEKEKSKEDVEKE